MSMAATKGGYASQSIIEARTLGFACHHPSAFAAPAPIERET